MRHTVNGVVQAITAWMGQQAASTLVLTTGAAGHAVTVAALRSVAATHADLVFPWVHDFTDPVAWTSAVRDLLAALHRTLATEGLPVPPWPACNPADGPVACMRALVAYTLALRPDPEGTVAVWGVLPARVVDPQAYGALMRALAPSAPGAPWCRGARLLVWEDTASPLAGDLACAQRATVDCSPSALARGLEADVDDPSLPLADRLDALLTVAAGDVAHGRIAAAVEKYGVIVGPGAVVARAGSLGVAQAGLGEALLLAGRVDEARIWLERALEPALSANAWPVVLSVGVRLAELATEQQRTHEAMELWTATRDLAGVLGLTSVADRCTVANDRLQDAGVRP